MSASDVPTFLLLQPAPRGLRAQAAALVNRVQGAVGQARTAITWSVGLSVAALALSTGAIVYVVASDRRAA